jgi:trans-aconitate 2-methyltransferase
VKEPSSRRYTFGQDEPAARRLALVDAVFRTTSERLLADLAGSRSFDLVVDLGCGPGWTTRSLREMLSPQRVIGLDESEVFVRHDVTDLPWPIEPADLVYARYLLTHLTHPEDRLVEWTGQTRTGGLVVVEDNAGIVTSSPSFAAYLDMAREVVAASGADLYVGSSLRPADAGLEVVVDRIAEASPPTPLVARMFRMNLASWRSRPAARRFARRLAELDGELAELERSPETRAITWRMRQLAVRRPA